MKRLLSFIAILGVALCEALEHQLFLMGALSYAYFGSTAASSVQNPPQLVYGGAGAKSILGTSNMTAWSSSVTRSGGVQIWRYNSTNLTTDVVSAGFFTDGYYLGMQIGDLLFGTQWTSAGSSFISYAGVLTTTNSTAGFNLSTGGTMTSTFN